MLERSGNLDRPYADPSGASKPSSYTPAYLRVAESIAQLIAVEGFRPGDRLPTEIQLSQRLGAGRTVVREAIKVLSATDLVRARRGSGIYVGDGSRTLLPGLVNLPAAVDPGDVENLFDFRAVLEVSAVRRAAQRISFLDLRRLEQAVEVNRTGAENHDAQQFVIGDRDFHSTIAEASGNSFLHSTVHQVMRLQAWVVDLMLSGPPGSLAAAVRQHEAILSRLRSGDADGAATAMDEHIRTTVDSYQREVRRRLIESPRTEPRAIADEPSAAITLKESGKAVRRRLPHHPAAKGTQQS